MTLSEKEELFAQFQATFVLELIRRGYGVTEGESYRPPEMAKIYAAQGKGVLNSNHCNRLAKDLNLFKGGVFLTQKSDYQEAGDLWKSMSTDEVKCCWGGDFTRVDADHFSFEYNGVE